MAYGFLKRQAKIYEGVKTYLKEGMIFEAFIEIIREADLPPEEIYRQIETEAYLKNSRLTEDEYESLQIEWDYEFNNGCL